MSGINGYRNVGYFAQWAGEEAGFTVADLDRTGQADSLTHINYSFAHIGPETLTVRLADDMGGDSSYADYGRLYSAEEAVDGVADDASQPLAGNWNQLRKLKKCHPDLKILVSLGGWTGSRDFSRVAATAENRERFVTSCIDSNLHPDPLRPEGDRTSIEQTIAHYTDNGVPAHQLNVGVPLYGRGWTGVADGSAAKRGWVEAVKAAPGKKDVGSASYDDLLEIGDNYYDADLGVAWRWDGDQWWGYDDEQSVSQKARFIAERQLGGAMYWALDSNQDGTLVNKVAEVLPQSTQGPSSSESVS